MNGTLEQLRKRGKGNTIRRDILAGIGRALYQPIMYPIAKSQLEKNHELVVEGRENIPTNRSYVTLAHHRDRSDVKDFLVAHGRLVHPLVDISGNATPSEWLLLELMGVSATLRDDKEMKQYAFQEMVRKGKMRRGVGQIVWNTTYHPELYGVFMPHVGSAIKVPMETNGLSLPAVKIIIPKGEFTDGEIGQSVIRYGKPIDPAQYTNEFRAAKDLQEKMLEMQYQMNRHYLPGVTEEEYSQFHWARARRFPDDEDYQQKYVHLIEHKKAETQKEKDNIAKKFMGSDDK